MNDPYPKNPRLANNAFVHAEAPRISHYCSTSGCSKITTNAKSHCLDHVAHNDHAKWVLSELAARNTEIKRAKRKRKSISTDGRVAQEILRELVTHGDLTTARLAQNLRLEGKVVSSFVAALLRKRLVLIYENRRGSETVRLAG